MPNNAVQGTAEGVSANRCSDPLLAVIRAYQRGYDDFNLNAPKTNDDGAVNAYVDASYGPHLRRLGEWEGPAGSMEGAIEALRISLSDDRGVQGSDAEPRMVAAALAYLENRPALNVDRPMILKAEDLVYECAHLSHLVGNAIESAEPDEDSQALRAGIEVIRRKLLDAAHLIDQSKTAH